MAHKTLVNGTAYDITGGKTLVSGTSYNIAGGKTLVGGTGYDISFNPYDPVFANNDWSLIIQACQNNEVPDTWAIGDQKAMNIGGIDYLIDIIGKNHDTYSTGGTAPLTFQMHDCYATKYRINSSNANSGGYGITEMHTTTLPAIFATMPTEVQEGIQSVNKISHKGFGYTGFATVSCNLFLLSVIEITGNAGYSYGGEGKQYDYYKANTQLKVKYLNGSASAWWNRSPCSTNGSSFCFIYAGGDGGWNNATTANGVSFAFCF